eukprot:scaffold116143_cov31-Tisochrysis_lutea.AAC.2
MGDGWQTTTIHLAYSCHKALSQLPRRTNAGLPLPSPYHRASSRGGNAGNGFSGCHRKPACFSRTPRPRGPSSTGTPWAFACISAEPTSGSHRSLARTSSGKTSRPLEAAFSCRISTERALGRSPIRQHAQRGGAVRSARVISAASDLLSAPATRIASCTGKDETADGGACATKWGQSKSCSDSG